MDEPQYTNKESDGCGKELIFVLLCFTCLVLVNPYFPQGLYYAHRSSRLPLLFRNREQGGFPAHSVGQSAVCQSQKRMMGVVAYPLCSDW